MAERNHRERVVCVHSLRDYFRSSIEGAAQNQGVSLNPQATQYVVNLLTLFARSDRLYEDTGESYGLKPLASMLADASEAANMAERAQILQRIGDVALFVSGFFSDSLARRTVDVDYYIRMGGTAYASLSDEVRGTARGDVFSDLYRELAVTFPMFVDVLNEVRDGGRGSDFDLLRTYEIWLKTGSPRAAALLREHGIQPVATDTRRH